MVCCSWSKNTKTKWDVALLLMIGEWSQISSSSEWNCNPVKWIENWGRSTHWQELVAILVIVYRYSTSTPKEVFCNPLRESTEYWILNLMSTGWHPLRYVYANECRTQRGTVSRDNFERCSMCPFNRVYSVEMGGRIQSNFFSLTASMIPNNVIG